MTQLGIVPNGALLIHKGVIEQIGTSRRVENLAGARKARELDATNKVVLPAFVDTDAALVTPGMADAEAEHEESSGLPASVSRKQATQRAAWIAAEFARYGTLSVGAHTRFAADIPAARKILRTHQTMQGRPLRIRSIFSPRLTADSNSRFGNSAESIINRWLSGVRKRKLSGLIELNIDGNDEGEFQSTQRRSPAPRSLLRAMAEAASGLGYAIRFRTSNCPEPADLQLALGAGAVAFVSPLDRLRAFAGPLGGIGCVRVIPATEAFDDPSNAAQSIRRGLSEGVAIALSSSYRPHHVFSINMQHLLHLAVQFLGLTEEEAITAVTWNAACSLRLSHVSGSLEPGKPADLVVMDVSDYRELPRRAGHHDASVVMRAGKVLYRSASLSVN